MVEVSVEEGRISAETSGENTGAEMEREVGRVEVGVVLGESSKLSTKERATGEGDRDAAQFRSWVTSRPSVEFRLGTTVGENVGDIMRIASGQLYTSDDSLLLVIVLGEGWQKNTGAAILGVQTGVEGVSLSLNPEERGAESCLEGFFDDDPKSSVV